jgi:hypothetical protein
VDLLLRPEADVEAFNRAHDRDEEAVAASGAAVALRAWWLRRMIETPHPLLERMALFWHDHFAVGAERVASAPLMRRHVRLLRAHALGSLPALMAGIVRDPATLVALGAEANRKGMPDDGFARQFLYRFTAGPAACTDRDVRDAARAMTGVFVLRGERREFERERDAGEKSILGRTGPFDDADLARIAAGSSAGSSATSTTRTTPSWRPWSARSETAATWPAWSGRSSGATGSSPTPPSAGGSIGRSNSPSASSEASKGRCRRPGWPRTWRRWARTCTTRPRETGGREAGIGSTAPR